MADTLHLHHNRLNSDTSVVLLLLPAFMFALVLALLLLSNTPNGNEQLAVERNSESAVLGEEVVFDK